MISTEPGPAGPPGPPGPVGPAGPKGDTGRAGESGKECPVDIGANSTCQRLPRYGCYCVSMLKQTWKEADRWCRDGDMQLVSVETREEQLKLADFLASMANGTALAFWTSGSDVEKEGQWVWTATGDELAYTNWAPRQPDNSEGVQHHLVIDADTFQWYDDDIVSELGTQWKGHAVCEL